MNRSITKYAAVVLTALALLSCRKSAESSDEKVRAFYESGYVMQNEGDMEGAMEMFVKGERHAEQCSDKSTLGNLYIAKMNINKDIYNFTQAISDANHAAECFLEADDQGAYFDAISELATLYHSINDSQNFTACMKLLKENWDFLTELQKSNCYAIWINRSCQFNAQESILDEYITEIRDSSVIMWSSIAYAHIWLDKPELAIKDLENALKYNGISKDASYYYVIALAHEKIGDSDAALAAYKRYIEITEETDKQIFESDTKFIEERHQKELALLNAQRSKERQRLIGIIVILAAVIVIYLIRRKLLVRTEEKRQAEMEKQRYEQLYSDAIAERDALTKMVEDANVKEVAKVVIRERLEILNKVIISHITDTSTANKVAYQKLEALVADTESFIESTRLTIESNNPEFISKLKEHDLTEDEINICCLYVIGLKGKDIKTYTHQSRHYIQSGEIRHKLGLSENDTNLSVYLKKLIEEL